MSVRCAEKPGGAVEIRSEDGKMTEFDTLEEAAAAASDGDTITLYQKVVLQKAVTFTSGKITLNLNGYSIDIAEGKLYDVPIIIVRGAELTVGADGKKGTVYDIGSDDHSYVDNDQSCIVSVQSGKYIQLSGSILASSREYAVVVHEGAEAVFNCYQINKIRNYGTVTIEDAKTYGAQNRGVMYIKGGTVSETNNLTLSNSGTLEISGGTVKHSGNGIAISNSGTLTVTGGEVTTNNGTAISDSHGTVTISGDAVISGKISTALNSNISLEGGTFVGGITLQNKYHYLQDVLADGCVYFDGIDAYGRSLVWNELALAGNPNVTIVPVSTVAAVEITDSEGNVTQYANIREALSAEKTGDTVKLLEDVSVSANLNLAEGATLDLNGKNLTVASGNTFTCNGALNYNGGTFSGAITMGANAAVSGACGDNLTWTLDAAGTLTVSGAGAMADYTSGATPWCEHRETIKTVIIESGVTGIGKCAFTDCSSLADVYYGGTESQWNDLVNTPEATYVHYSCTTSANHWHADSKDAACEEIGYTRETCPCGYERNRTDVPATGHDHEAVVTAPTCEKDGYTTYTCHCGDTYVDDEVAALGHDWTEWEETAATCTKDGSRTRYCQRDGCGETETEVISATGHHHTAVVTAPTCEAEGYTTYTCHCGDIYTDDAVAALGHDMGEWVITHAATCTEEGEKRKTCSRCDHVETEVIPATDHKFENGICGVCGAIDPEYVVPLEITSQPESVTVKAGEQATATVVVSGEGLKYQWYYTSNGSTSEFYKSSTTTATYSTTMDSSRNGRKIYCVITDKYGNSVTSNTVTLSMSSSLKITQQPKDVTVASGATAKTSVVATGEGLTYQWYYTSNGSTSEFYKSSTTTATYSTTMDSSRDGRRVYCVITDKYGNSVTSNTVTLSMSSSLKITQQPKDVTVASGATAKTSVVATGEGLTYQWYYTSNGSTSAFYKSSTTTATYSTTMDSSRDGRKVYCVITDKYGNSVKSNTVTLSMSSGLKITQQPKGVTVANGETAKTSAVATGEGLKYQWYYTSNGSTSAFYKSSTTTATYSTTMDSSRDGRKVYCVITDKYGNSVKSETVTLRMK